MLEEGKMKNLHSRTRARESTRRKNLKNQKLRSERSMSGRIKEFLREETYGEISTMRRGRAGGEE